MIHVQWALFPVSMVVAWALGYLARWLGPRVGMMDVPDEHLKPHERPISLLGGVAVAGGLVVGLLTRALTTEVGAAQAIPRWGAILAFAGAFILGLLDDRHSLPPIVRFIGEIGLGVLVALVLPAVALPGPILAFGVAVLLFVGVINAVNMVDGIDGLAASCAAIAAVGIAMVGIRGQGLVVVIVTAGASVGFLLHNWPPARLFLGDNGAYALGAALTVSILVHGRTPQSLGGGITCLGIIGLDIGLAVLRRIFGGVPLMEGDRGHFYDQLIQRGRSARSTLLVCLLLQVGFVVAGLAISRIHLSKVSAIVFLVFWGAVAAVLGLTGFIRARPSVNESVQEDAA